MLPSARTACRVVPLLLLASTTRAVVLDVSQGRLAVELTHKLILTPNSSEPPFPIANDTAHCVLTGAGGYAIGLPTAQPLNASGMPVGGGVLRKNLMGGLLILPATVNATTGSASCELPPLSSAGNTSVCVVFGTADPWGPAPAAGWNNACNGTWAQPAYFERFALFSPQFGRRPYFHEQEGTVVLLTDWSLRGEVVELAGVVNGTAPIAATITGGDNVSVPFSLASLPATLTEDVELVLTVRGRAGIRASHTRRFVRAPPPPSGSAVRAWQVDHTSKGVLVDGTPLVMVGWFGSGGLHESAGLPAKLVDPALSLEQLQTLATASVTTEWARQGHTFVKASFLPVHGDNVTQVLSKQYMDAAAAAGVHVLLDVSYDGLALAMAGQPKDHDVSTPRNATQFRDWLLGNLSFYKDHPAVGGYYGCDDCCHTSIAIERNLGEGCTQYPVPDYPSGWGPGSEPGGHVPGRAARTGCPGEFWALAEVRRWVQEHDPYHLVFGALARCFGDGAYWWSEEGAGLGLDVVMHESYGAGITTIQGFRAFPMEFAPIISMPDPGSLGQPHSVKAHEYSHGLSADAWNVNAFVYNAEQYFGFRADAAVSLFAQEMAELVPSALSTFWADGGGLRSGGGGCVMWDEGHGREVSQCPVGVNVTGLQSPSGALYPPDARVDNRPVRVVARLLLEAPPPDALDPATYFCAHLISVMEADVPAIVQYQLWGLPAGVTRMQRLFDGGWTVNISATDGRTSDVIGGRASVVHRLGCNDQGDMLPLPRAGELVKGGDMEALNPDLPGQLLSDHHSGPWYLLESGAATDPLRPGRLVPTTLPLSDDRQRVNADTGTAHGGRRSAKVNVPTDSPLFFPVPTNKLPAGLVTLNVTAFLRSSPAGLLVAPAVATVASGDALSLGTQWRRLFVPRLVVNGSTLVGARATLLQLRLESPFTTGGTIWIDDVSVVVA